SRRNDRHGREDARARLDRADHRRCGIHSARRTRLLRLRHLDHPRQLRFVLHASNREARVSTLRPRGVLAVATLLILATAPAAFAGGADTVTVSPSGITAVFDRPT